MKQKIEKKKFPLTDINLINPNLSSAGDTLLYIKNHLSYKLRNDLCIYKPVKLESTFIEL